LQPKKEAIYALSHRRGAPGIEKITAAIHKDVAVYNVVPVTELLPDFDVAFINR